MKYLKKYSPAPGLTKIVKKKSMGLKLTEFGIIQMRRGEESILSNGDNETALIVLGGKCRVSGAGFEFPDKP